jgi:hypothetical protein
MRGFAGGGGGLGHYRMGYNRLNEGNKVDGFL